MDMLTVNVVTPDRQVTHAEVREVRAPSAMGQIGILPGHTTLLSHLVPGIIELVGPNAREVLAISGGFLEVERDRVVVLAETAEHAGDIDIERARRALAAAEGKLKALAPVDQGYLEAEAHLLRARTRLLVAGQ